MCTEARDGREKLQLHGERKRKALDTYLAVVVLEALATLGQYVDGEAALGDLLVLAVGGDAYGVAGHVLAGGDTGEDIGGLVPAQPTGQGLAARAPYLRNVTDTFIPGTRVLRSFCRLLLSRALLLLALIRIRVWMKREPTPPNAALKFQCRSRPFPAKGKGRRASIATHARYRLK
jgi:hypothetical protein